MRLNLELLTDNQVHEIYGVMPKTLANWRWRGVGPKFVKIGHQVRYRPEDLKAFLESRIFASTSAYLKANNLTRKPRGKMAQQSLRACEMPDDVRFPKIESVQPPVKAREK